MPESRVIPTKKGSRDFLYIRDAFLNAGQDSNATAPSQDPDKFESLSNVMPPYKGGIYRRWGYNLASNPGQVYRRLYTYDNDTSIVRRIIATSTTRCDYLTEAGASATSIFSPSGSKAPRMISSRDYAYFCDGASADLKKWDGTTASKWGIAPAVTSISLGATSAGSVSLTKGRKYYAVFKNSTTGHISDLNTVSATTGSLTSKQQPLSNIPSSADTQVDKVIVLATADGGDETTLYKVTELANGVTTYTDNTPEATLLVADVYQETTAEGLNAGVADNATPPNGDFLIKHQGRLWMAVGSFLYFSKSADELISSTGATTGRYEEAWPATNFMDISEGAETVRGLFSDGMSLFIATEKHIRRLDGDSVFNFNKPEVVFNNVGILNQEVCQTVYSDGNPGGAIWLTPDFKVVQSDFSSYRNIGDSVQDVLNSLNSAVAVNVAHAAYISQGGYDLYVLAVPTGSNTECDTLLVYDLGSNNWVVWTLTDKPSAMLAFVNSSGVSKAFMSVITTGKFYELGAAYSRDRTADTPVDFTSTIQTSWLNLSDPTMRKHLNDIEVMPATSVAIDGASMDSEFSSPTAVLTATTPTASFLGELRVPLAGKTTKDRHYRLKFTSSTNTTSPILEYFKLTVLPIHNI